MSAVMMIAYIPFALSLSFDRLRMIGKADPKTPFGLSLSKPLEMVAMNLPFDKLRANGPFNEYLRAAT